jgi:hypothetical protein
LRLDRLARNAGRRSLDGGGYDLIKIAAARPPPSAPDVDAETLMALAGVGRLPRRQSA